MRQLSQQEELAVNNAISAIEIELRNALTKFPKPMNSAHEGYAVIKEEVDELWDAVKNNKEDDALRSQIKECIQIGAMAARYIAEGGGFIEQKPADLIPGLNQD